MRNLRHRGTGHGPRRVATAVGVVLLAAAVSWSGPAAADDERPAALAGSAPAASLPLAGPSPLRHGGGGFFHGHLLPRLEKQLETLGPYQVLSAEEGRLLFERATRDAQRRAGRGTRRALKEYLLASTSVGRFVDGLEWGGRRSAGAQGRAPRIGLGIRSGVPDLEYRRALGRGLLRAALSVEGRVRLEYRGGLASTMGLRVDYDPVSRELDLAYRVGF